MKFIAKLPYKKKRLCLKRNILKVLAICQKSNSPLEDLIWSELQVFSLIEEDSKAD